MERAAIDIITDGEIRRESYSNRFATALSDVDLDNPATVRGRTSGTVVVPGPRALLPGEGSAWAQSCTTGEHHLTVPAGGDRENTVWRLSGRGRLG